jgi:hypothetical protein
MAEVENKSSEQQNYNRPSTPAPSSRRRNLPPLSLPQTYADIVEAFSLFTGGDPQELGNNVVPRNRVNDALYSILEEVENIRENLSENVYLLLTNQLRTVYDYISQNDLPGEAKEEKKQETFNFINPTFVRNPLNRPNQVNEGSVGLTTSMKLLYSLLRWTIRDSPFKKIWQIIIILLWLNLVLLFAIVSTFIRIIQKFFNNILKTLGKSGILILEEILLSEHINGFEAYRILLIECTRLGRIALNRILS